jgi:DNA-binding NtrC family response regulator
MSFDVLIVDDDEKLLDVLAAVLASTGCGVTTARSGPEALRLLDNRTFGLILADLRMPKMDGVQLLKAIPLFQPGAKVVLMSAYMSNETARDAGDNGVYDCLRKPFTLADLRAVVDRARQDQSRNEEQ